MDNAPERPIEENEREALLTPPANSGTAAEMPYFFSPLPRSSAGFMAVVDEQGYLVPIMTDLDLLRALQALWRLELK